MEVEEVGVGPRKMAASWVVAVMTEVVVKVGEVRAKARAARVKVREMVVVAKVGVRVVARVSKAGVRVKLTVAEARARVEPENSHPGPQAVRQRGSQNERRALAKLFPRDTSCKRPQW